VVTQDVLSYQEFGAKGWYALISERRKDAMSGTERSAGSICANDEPGPAGLVPADFPYGLSRPIREQSE